MDKKLAEKIFINNILNYIDLRDLKNPIIDFQGVNNRIIKEIEDILRLKTADVRKNAIALILSLESSKLLEATENLVKDKNANKRLAGLDILTKIKDKQDFAKEKIERRIYDRIVRGGGGSGGCFGS